MADQEKRGGCLKWGAIGLGGLVALGVIGAVLGDPAAETAPGPDRTIPAIVVSAEELHAAFAANEVSAKARFGGQPLVVTGTVQAIELDLFDNPQVRLAAGNEFEWVTAGFDKEASAATGQLSQGQEVTVRCAEVSEVIGNPMLSGCVIE
jgi:hypothetical protein